jgi:transposase
VPFAGVGEAIEAAGATLLYLPPYSPDLNPIELAFRKLEAHLRQAAEHTIPGWMRRIGRVVKAFSPRECRNFFRHVDYVQIRSGNYAEQLSTDNPFGAS